MTAGGNLSSRNMAIFEDKLIAATADAHIVALDTKTGVFHEGRGFGEAAYEVEYVAQLSKVDVDKAVAELNAEIQSLQDALDEFNFIRSVSL